VNKKFVAGIGAGGVPKDNLVMYYISEIFKGIK
jgi:hypothetical protein